VRVADLSFWIMGIQGRRAANGSAVVQLPTYRDINGLAKPAVVGRNEDAAQTEAPNARRSES
jgi:hypothetical protein